MTRPAPRPGADGTPYSVERPSPAIGTTSVIALVVLAIVTATHLVSQFIPAAGTVSDVTQVLLMPLLAAVLATSTHAPRPRLARWVLAALFFSWLGDTVPRFLDGDAGFLAMVAGFLVSQCCYVVAFAPRWRGSVLCRAPWLVAPYLLAAAGLLIWCYPGVDGVIFIAVVVYALAISTMAILATGLGQLATTGGIVFMVSDSLIALRAFTAVALPASGFWVMSTYVAGQTMPVWAALRLTRPQAPVTHN